jgi:photosystem II stability/assembly factor-like uncharacterized protein
MNMSSAEMGACMRPTSVHWFRWFAWCLVALGVGLLAACGGGGGGASAAPGLVITAQPADTHVEPGATATFSVQVSGAAQFQWQVHPAGAAANEWHDIAGATSNVLTTAPVTDANHNDQYRVVITVDGNSRTSSIATLSVDAAPVAPTITVQPADASVIEGQAVNFNVTASGTSLNYRWQTSRDGATWADSMSGSDPTLTITAQFPDDGTQVRVIVSNPVGSVTSAAAHLGVQHPPAAPVFATLPRSVSVVAGQPASFDAQAFGAPTPDIAWQVSADGVTWATIAGATAGTYTLTAASLQDNNHQYRAVASNSVGTVASPSAWLSVSPVPAAPVITAAPSDTSVAESSNAVFSVTVTGQPTPTLQWQVSADGGATFANINGATSDTYVDYGAWPEQDGQRFRVVATNSLGTATSASARLSVIALPTFTLQPAATAWRPGSVPAYFLAGVAGSGSRLQWQASRDAGTTWSDIPGATGTSLALSAPGDADVDRVRLAATNAGGTVYSVAATVTPIHSVPVSGTLTSTHLYGVRWTGPTTAIAAGGLGTMLRSTDSGATWSITAQLQASSPLALAVHGQTALALGYGWSLLRSVDAGAHWINAGNLPIFGTARGLAFSGTAATAVGDNGVVQRSTDGGLTWQAAPTGGATSTLRGVAFNAAGVGIAVGDGGNVLRSTDAGATWTSIAAGLPTLLDVSFVNANTVVAVGYGGAVVRSTDAGLGWQSITTGASFQLSHVDFDGAGNGSAVGAWTTDQLHTSDSGRTWTIVQGAIAVEAVAYAPVSGGAIAIAVGAGGALETSSDGGLAWTTRTLSPHPVLRGIAFASPTIAIAVGNAGAIVRSVDGGDSWAAVTTPSTTPLMFDVAFATPQVGIAVGDGGTVWRTSDAGATWRVVMAGGPQMFNAVHFTSATHGVAVGSGSIIFTDDAGLTWHTASTVGQPKVQAVAFGSPLVGVAVGDGLPLGGWGFAGGAIVRTTDGGATWTPVALPASVYLTSVSFIDANTVVAVGFYGELRSTDAGQTWSSVPVFGWQWNALSFAGAGDGQSVLNDGFLLRTHDGGLNWTDGEYITDDELCRLVVSPAGKTFVTTAGGAIYRYDGS